MRKDRSHLKEKKLELERYPTALGAGIAQIATQLQDPEINNAHLLALEQEAASATQKLKDVVGFFISKPEQHSQIYML